MIAREAYWRGWFNAATWADRDDLHADRGSHAYQILEDSCVQETIESASLPGAPVLYRCVNYKDLYEQMAERCTDLDAKLAESGQVFAWFNAKYKSFFKATDVSYAEACAAAEAGELIPLYTHAQPAQASEKDNG